MKVEEDISMLEHESKELAQQVQKLESENSRLRKFKEQVQDYIFKAKDSNESSFISDVIQELLDV